MRMEWMLVAGVLLSGLSFFVLQNWIKAETAKKEEERAQVARMNGWQSKTDLPQGVEFIYTGGSGEKAWEMLSKRAKSRNSKGGGHVIWRMGNPLAETSQTVLVLSPRPEMPAGIDFKSPFFRSILTMVLGEELGGFLSQATPIPALSTGESWLILAKDPDMAGKRLEEGLRAWLSSWTAQEKLETMVIFGRNGTEIRLTGQDHPTERLHRLVAEGVRLSAMAGP